MIRDQAKVTVRATADSGFTLSDAGYYVCNTNAFGTIAPYNRRTNAFDWRVSNPKYITLPKETERTTTPLDVANQTAQYVFETPNELSDPVNLIIKGANQGETEKYYRVLLLDNMTGEPIPLVKPSLHCGSTGYLVIRLQYFCRGLERSRYQQCVDFHCQRNPDGQRR